MKLEIRFIRHGFTTSNEQHRYLGKSDESLSENGRALLLENGGKIGRIGRIERLNGTKGELLFVSPMRRCRETAEVLFPGREEIRIPEWTEIDFGDFEGRNFEELKDVPAYRAWIESGGRLPFPSGEAREDFIARSMRGYERMLAGVRENVRETVRETAEKEQEQSISVTAVVNGGTIMAVCSSLFGGDYFDYQISCGGEYICPAVLI